MFTIAVHQIIQSSHLRYTLHIYSQESLPFQSNTSKSIAQLNYYSDIKYSDTQYSDTLYSNTQYSDMQYSGIQYSDERYKASYFSIIIVYY